MADRNSNSNSKPRRSHKCRIVRGNSIDPLFPSGYWIEIQTLAGETVMRSVSDYRDIKSAQEDAIACFNCEGWYIDGKDDQEGPRTFRPHGITHAVAAGGKQ